MAKTAAFGAMHVGIAFTVTYLLTGSVLAAGAVTLIEPAVNMVAHYFFDKHWNEERVDAWLAHRGAALRRCFTWNKQRSGKGNPASVAREAVA